MNNFTVLMVLAVLSMSLPVSAQTEIGEIKSENPNTAMAFLMFDYKFNQSGFEQVSAASLNVQPGSWGMLNFKIDPQYDYTFIGIADSITDGMSIKGHLAGSDETLFTTDGMDVFMENNAKTIVITFANAIYGDLIVQPTILGETAPKELSYYLLVRKKKQ